MDNWLEARRNRLASRRMPFQIAYKESPTGGFMYVPDEFLIHEDLVAGLSVELSATGMVAPGDRVGAPSTAWLDGTGLLVYGWDREADLLPEAVANLRAAASDNRVSLHYVLSGEIKPPTVPRGGPASAPELFDPVPSPADWGDDGSAPVVAVLDTGVYARSQADEARTSSGRRAVVFRAPAAAGGADDIDRLHALSPAGQPLPVLGAEAGHGSFIAALIQRMALGGVRLESHKVLDTEGLGRESDIVEALRSIRLRHGPKPKVINLSLGGFTDDGGWAGPNPEIAALYEGRANLMPLGLGTELANWAGDPLNQTVFVCAAGNDGQERKFWPAAAAGEPVAGRAPIVAVGSLDAALGASDFSNRGDWVNVSTLGEGIVSDYPRGLFPIGPGDETESFPGGGARWSGTSFATPIIAAELARRSLGVSGNLPLSGAAAWQAFSTELVGAPLVGGLGSAWDPREATPPRNPREP